MSAKDAPKPRYVTVGPRTFIAPPYEKCPHCGAQELGVLMILERHYVRRCKACLNAVRVDLPPLHKKIVYVDQFAISDMMKALNPGSRANVAGRVSQRWVDLFRKLDHLIKLQLIACPDSLFHRKESEASPFEEALRRLYELLSGGLTFEDAAYIEQSQIRQGFEQWLDGVRDPTFELDAERMIHGRVHGWRERFILSVHLRPLPEDIVRRREVRDSAGHQMEELFRSWRTQQVSFDQRVLIEVRAYGEVLLSQLADSARQNARILAGIEELTPDALLPLKPKITFLVMRDVLSARGCDRKDQLPKIEEYLTSSAMGMLPFLKIGPRLFAALARQAQAGRKRPPRASLLTDVTMVSVLLPYCDAMLVDNEMATLAREAGVPTAGIAGRIFSSNTLADFIEYLGSIEAACTPEHRELVASVYGPKGTEPFDTLFTVGDDGR